MARNPALTRAEAVVGRRFLEHGFVDDALRLFVRAATHVGRRDWMSLVDGLMERGRIADAVTVCQRAGLPVPREELLALGDRLLARRDVDGAVAWYELAGADCERWSRVLDALIALPGRELRALAVAKRYLGGTPLYAEPRTAAAS